MKFARMIIYIIYIYIYIYVYIYIYIYICIYIYIYIYYNSFEYRGDDVLMYENICIPGRIWLLCRKNPRFKVQLYSAGLHFEFLPEKYPSSSLAVYP